MAARPWDNPYGMRHVQVFLAAALALSLFILGIALMLPGRYEASVIISVQASPEAVWIALTAPEAYPSWRSEIAKVELEPSGAWIEMDGEGGRYRHRANADSLPGKFVDSFETVGNPGNRGVTLAPPAAAGEREILLLTDADDRTRVAVREKGTIRGAWAKLRARAWDGYNAGVEKFGEDLKRRMAE